MYQMLLYGVLLGIAATLFVQELRSSLERYRDRKQAEFDAAVQAAAAHRKAQAERDWHNVSILSDDPFADV